MVNKLDGFGSIDLKNINAFLDQKNEQILSRSPKFVAGAMGSFRLEDHRYKQQGVLGKELCKALRGGSKDAVLAFASILRYENEDPGEAWAALEADWAEVVKLGVLNHLANEIENRSRVLMDDSLPHAMTTVLQIWTADGGKHIDTLAKIAASDRNSGVIPGEYNPNRENGQVIVLNHNGDKSPKKEGPVGLGGR